MAQPRSRAPAAAAARVVAALALACAPLSASAASVYAVQPSRGSLEGGTYVTVWGTGFNRNGVEGRTIA